MKGYITSFGYMGYIPRLKKYFLYATEDEYKEAYNEEYF